MRFIDRLRAAQLQNQSTLAVGFAPSLNRMPLEFQRYDDPFLPFGKAVIDATRDVACAYVFHLAAYLALGAAGIIALERTIAYVPDPLIKILDGPFTTVEYADAAFKGALSVDAVTLSLPVLAYDVIEFYVGLETYGVFLDTSYGVDMDLLLRLTKLYPGQIGVFRHHADEYYIASMLPENDPALHCYDAIYPHPHSEQDFKTELHDALSYQRDRLSKEGDNGQH